MERTMFKKIIIGLLMPLFFLGCEDQKSSENIMKVATSGDNLPYEFYENGQLTGFDIDLMKKIGAKLGKTIEFVDMDFGGIIAALQSGRVDAAIAGLTPTQERKVSVDFSEPYYQAVPAFITLRENSFSSILELQGKTLGVQMGSTHEKTAEKAAETIHPLTVRSLNKIPELIQDLKAKRIDAILIGGTEAKAIAAADSMLFAQENVKDLHNMDTGNAIALPKESPYLELINEALRSLEEEKGFAALKKQWALN